MTICPYRLTCLDLEIAVAKHFDYRSHVIVPNVYWGLGFRHELDVLVLSGSGYVTEIEIKTNARDLRRDLRKDHKHLSPRISRHFLALPKPLIALALELFPADWGILSVDEETRALETLRPAKRNKLAKPLKEEEIMHLYRLASMRTWTLKETLARRIHREGR
jgi:hypothetical protein